jgi:formate-dependent nitrite reductase membrane component NrfD
LFFNSLPGLIVSLFIIAFVKGSAHFLELRKPSRSWRMALHVRSSWISRGMVLMVLFLGFALIHVYLYVYHPGTSLEVVFKITAAAGAVVLSLYSGFVLCQVSAVHLWNSSLLPVLLSSSGMMGGLGLIGVIGLFDTSTNIMEISKGTGAMIIGIGILLGVYVVSESGSGPVGKETMRRIAKDGELAPFVWIGLVTVGMIVPFALAAVECLGQNIHETVLAIAILFCGIVQGLSLVYAILKGGVYRPLIPVS